MNRNNSEAIFLNHNIVVTKTGARSESMDSSNDIFKINTEYLKVIVCLYFRKLNFLVEDHLVKFG